MRDNNIATTIEDTIFINVKEIIMKLVKLASSDDELINLRKGACNLELFQTLNNCYLIHFSIYIKWLYKVYNTFISDIFTESDKK